MNSRQLKNLGIRDGETRRLAIRLIGPAMHAGLKKSQMRHRIKAVVDDPAAHVADEYFAQLAKQLLPAEHPDSTRKPYQARLEPAPWRQWGDNLDPNSIQQMQNACELPVAVRAALMPDAHLGYGLPIGGVLATDNAVIPYAVGVDIACRMKMTVLDLPPSTVEDDADRLIKAIETETRFGIGAEFKGKRREHDVMDKDWNVTPITRHLKPKAHAQLGTSGSGNHFVEFGIFDADEDEAGQLHLPSPGEYLALLSHSGSRGPGAQICQRYSQLAMQKHRELPKELRYLAWLDLDTAEGQEYWAAMNLMGEYAAANHAVIHHHIARHLGAQVLLDVENHHNFAWKETHGDRELIVHRKGATPADQGVLGIIPGSMAAPAFLVRGKGNADSLNSASHGAGRVMSRRQARDTYRWGPVNDYLKHRNVRLLSAGIDEVPFVYKDIHEVMAHQRDLVETLGRFNPRLVKMAPAGERPED